MKKPEAVIWDMDGVIVDSEPWWLVAMDQEFEKAGVKLSPEEFRMTTGLRLDEVIAYWYTKYDFDIDSPKTLEQNIYDEVLRLVTTEAGLMPGLVEVLEKLRDQNIPIGLASSSSMQLIEGIVKYFKITEYFDVIQSAESFEYGKPHPEVFISTAKQLGAKNNKDCIVIEDSLNGIISAKASRMKCIVMPDPEKKELMQFSLADKVVASLHELRDLQWFSILD